jgi:hypothetical protein
MGAGTGTVTSEGITCGTDCSEIHDAGEVLTLTANAVAGSTFAGWSGDADCTDGAVTMDSARTCTATFNLVTAAGITVTSPNGGESWRAGVNHRITWKYTGKTGAYVKIELLRNGVLVRTIAYSAWIGSGGSGSRIWKPAYKLSGGNYSIRITSRSNSGITDTSDGVFTITRR